jgi:DNA-binding transcriptional ArsR family regulator
MKEGPSIAPIAALAGDPARANMLAALLAGKALTASELAGEAGVTPQTASSHLAKLEEGGLVLVQKQGRHRYFRLSGPDVAGVLESMMGLAARIGHSRTRTGPREPALRRARVCYDHLAGELGVEMFDKFAAAHLIAGDDDQLSLTRRGEKFLREFGIDFERLEVGRRPMCKSCLDWSMRRSHLAGAAGAALLARFFALKWASRDRTSRAVIFSRDGEAKFQRMLGALPRSA